MARKATKVEYTVRSTTHESLGSLQRMVHQLVAQAAGHMRSLNAIALALEQLRIANAPAPRKPAAKGGKKGRGT